MPALSINPPFPIFTDSDGQPLDDAYIYIGTANQNPVSNPITVYWDQALTIPAAQPIRTIGGYPVYNGTPARFYTNSDYSILVRDKNGSFLYTAASETDLISSEFVTFVQAGSGAVATTIQVKLRQTVSVKDFGALGDGITDDSAAIYNAITYINSIGGGTLNFEPNAQYIVKWSWDTYGALGVRFENCKGLRLVGNGCTLKVKDGARCGIFSGTYKDEGYGFLLRGCEDVEISGFLWNGNKANVSYGTADGNCIGLFLQSNKRVSVRNCTFRKFATDGGYTGDGPLSINNEDLYFENVIFDGNRRQGFSGCGHDRATYVNCKFINTGDDGIKTNPQSGYDFEPIPPAITNNSVFINCLFKNNGLTQTVADSGQTNVTNASFHSCVFDCDSATTATAVWCKNQTFVFRDCEIYGNVQYAYGKFYNCDVTMGASNNGTYAIDFNQANQPMLWQGGRITVSGGKKVFNLQGTIASDDERKIFDGIRIYLDGTSLSSGDFWAIHRNSTFINSSIFLSGTLPASPFYLSNTNGLILNCESFSTSLTLGTTSATARASWSSLTPLRLAQPTSPTGIGLTIASGAITATTSLHRVDTEGSAATDDLDTINGGYPYQRLIIFASSAARTIVIKHNTGNILLDGSTDKTLDNSVDMIELMYEPIAGRWLQLSFSNNGT